MAERLKDGGIAGAPTLSAHEQCSDSVVDQMPQHCTPSGVATSFDSFLAGRVWALQPKSGYRAGIDAVLLAAAANIDTEAPCRILDAGAGVGVVGLCVAARGSQARVTLVERAPVLCALAQQNIAQNGWQDRMDVIEGDLTAPASNLVARGLTLESYDHVLANPPFYDQGRGTPAPDPLKAGSHIMGHGELDRWAKFMAAVVKPGGSMTLIHRADHLDQVLTVLSRRFGALRLLPVHPRAGEPASRIIVQGIKGSKAPLTLLPGFYLHNEADGFLPQAAAIFKDGAALEMA